MNPTAHSFSGQRWAAMARLEPGEWLPRCALRKMVDAAGWRDVNVETRDFLLPGVPQAFVKPTIAIEPALEALP